MGPSANVFEVPPRLFCQRLGSGRPIGMRWSCLNKISWSRELWLSMLALHSLLWFGTGAYVWQTNFILFGGAFGDYDYQKSSELIRRPCSSFIKWLYVFFRYGGLIAQGADLVFVMRMETYKPISRDLCRGWITYQAIIVEVLLMSVDGLLIIRVYAMWSRSRKVLGVLVLLVLLELCSMARSASVIVPDPNMNELCLFRETPRAAALFGFVALSTQFMIMFLTLRKHFSTFARQLLQVHLSVLVVRDGGIAFMGIFSIFLCALCYAVLASEYSDTLFYWIVCTLSLCGCRIIINMDRYAARTSLPQRTTDAVWLTTDIYIDNQELGTF